MQNKIKQLFDKIDKYMNDKQNNDDHNLLGGMLSNIFLGRINRIKDKEDILVKYFIYSPEVFDDLKEMKVPKLIKFLETVIKNWSNI
jgi:hypothetical protein